MTTTNPNGVEVVTETPAKIEESKAVSNQCGKSSTNAPGDAAKDGGAYCGKMSMGLMACIAFIAIAAIGGLLGIICGATDVCSGGAEDVAADGSTPYYYYGDTMPTPEPTEALVAVLDDSCLCNYGAGCDSDTVCYFDDDDQTTCACYPPFWPTPQPTVADGLTPAPTPEPIDGGSQTVPTAPTAPTASLPTASTTYDSPTAATASPTPPTASTTEEGQTTSPTPGPTPLPTPAPIGCSCGTCPSGQSCYYDNLEETTCSCYDTPTPEPTPRPTPRPTNPTCTCAIDCAADFHPLFTCQWDSAITCNCYASKTCMKFGQGNMIYQLANDGTWLSIASVDSNGNYVYGTKRWTQVDDPQPGGHGYNQRWVQIETDGSVYCFSEIAGGLVPTGFTTNVYCYNGVGPAAGQTCPQYTAGSDTYYCAQYISDIASYVNCP